MTTLIQGSTFKRKAVIVVAMLLFSQTFALAQQPITEVNLARLTRFDLKQQYIAQFRAALSTYVQQARADNSNIMAEAYFEKERPAVLWLIERWTAANGPNKLIKNIDLLSTDALAAPVKLYMVKDLEPLTKAQWRRAARVDDKPLTVMLFVDAKKGSERSFIDIYHKAMPAFRGEPGVVTYQISQIAGQETKFVTYEKFRNDGAFQYHLKFPPIQPVIDFLNTSIEKPPFQAGIHNLIEFAPLARENSNR